MTRWTESATVAVLCKLAFCLFHVGVIIVLHCVAVHGTVSRSVWCIYIFLHQHFDDISKNITKKSYTLYIEPVLVEHFSCPIYKNTDDVRERFRTCNQKRNSLFVISIESVPLSRLQTTVITVSDKNRIRNRRPQNITLCCDQIHSMNPSRVQDAITCSSSLILGSRGHGNVAQGGMMVDPFVEMCVNFCERSSPVKHLMCHLKTWRRTTTKNRVEAMNLRLQSLKLNQCQVMIVAVAVAAAVTEVVVVRSETKAIRVILGYLL